MLAPRDEANDERGEIEAVVIDYLIENGGSAPASDVLKATRAAGLNDSAVKKARKRIGVKTEKRGMKSGWEWSIDFSKVPEGARALFRESSAPSGILRRIPAAAASPAARPKYQMPLPICPRSKR
ncbi:hypothetical protein JKI95_09220 [Corynebacterium aquatimens]|uniref:hypothetical protein n=1 Tax=Corynebacterium aquatimens TaxID=1190508 RepID=UPI002540D485|nr:hypothetical protein [Corynebacterium aquatimens]QYH19315.1 hypothetical protein JKI95_09220 [Corynebacterium aquatimens]